MELKKYGAAFAILGANANMGYAQSSVTVYGVVDTPIEYVTHMATGAPSIDAGTGAVTPKAGGSRVSMVAAGGMSGSRWGLRGVEELGSNLKAIFVLESGFGADDGKNTFGGRLFGRQAFVGLDHRQLGRLMFGRQTTSMWEAFANFTPLAYSPLYEPSTLLLGQNSRPDNTVKYSGTFGPLVANVHWTFGAGASQVGSAALAGSGAGETPGSVRDNSGFGASLIYAQGQFGAALAYDQWNPAVVTGNAGTAKKAGGALSYQLGRAKLMAGYRWGDTKDAAGVNLFRDDFYWAGVSYAATPAVNVDLGYYYDNAKLSRISSVAPSSNPANPWQISLRAAYSFSKRTDVYVTTAYAKNAGLNLDSTANGFASGYYLAQGNTDQFGAAVGLRHKF